MMSDTSKRRSWIDVAVGLAVLLGLAAAWAWTDLRAWVSPERLSEQLEPYRRSWLGLPLVVAVFVVAELFVFPVLVLVFVCGLTFGPWLGAAYALTGAVAGAVLPFFIGRWLGRRRVERWGGAPLRALDRILKRKGVLAVFLVRKIPAPFSLVNLACGAAGVGLPDFLLGTCFGMATGVVLLTVVGAQFSELLADPDPANLALMGGVLVAAIAGTLLVQRLLNRRLERQAGGDP